MLGERHAGPRSLGLIRCAHDANGSARRRLDPRLRLLLDQFGNDRLGPDHGRLLIAHLAKVDLDGNVQRRRFGVCSEALPHQGTLGHLKRHEGYAVKPPLVRGADLGIVFRLVGPGIVLNHQARRPANPRQNVPAGKLRLLFKGVAALTGVGLHADRSAP